MTANFLIMWKTVSFWRILFHGISGFGTTLQVDIELGKSILFARYFEVVTLFTDECPKVY